MKSCYQIRNRLMFPADLFLIGVAALGSFALRTDLGPLFDYYLPQAYWLLGIALLVKPAGLFPVLAFIAGCGFTPALRNLN